MKIKYKLLIVVLLMLTIFSLIKVPTYAAQLGEKSTYATSDLRSHKQERDDAEIAVEGMISLFRTTVAGFAIMFMIVGISERIKYENIVKDDNYTEQFSEDEIIRLKRQSSIIIKISIYLLLLVFCASFVRSMFMK